VEITAIRESKTTLVEVVVLVVEIYNNTMALSSSMTTLVAMVKVILSSTMDIIMVTTKMSIRIRITVIWATCTTTRI